MNKGFLQSLITHINHLFNNMKLKRKLILIIAVVSATISIFTGFGFSYVISQYNRLLYNQTANSLSFFSDELTYQLESIESVSSYIGLDSTFQENLNTYNTLPHSELLAQKARTGMTDMFNRYYTPDMIHITILTENGTALWWGKSALHETEKNKESLLKECDEAEGQAVWRSTTDGSGILCARKILQVKNLSLKPMGYLIIEMDLNRIIDRLSQSRYAGGQQFQIFISAKDRLIYPADNESYTALYKALYSAGSSYAIKNVAGSRMFITYAKLPLRSADWNISLAVPYDNIFHSLNRLVPVFILSLITAVLIASALAGNIVSNISKQFHLLMGKMERVRQEGVMGESAGANLTVKPFRVVETKKAGEMSQSAEVSQEAGTSQSTDFSLLTTSQDEMTVLNSYFDQMVVELKKLIEESYVKELLITQAELKSLEQQVNPHFLYNTLNSINWLAKKAGAKDISVIAESLGNMLQNTLSSKQTVITLEKELEIVSSYVKIQQIRFDDLVVEYDIDSSVLQAEIPKMTIQPLVENGILHSQEEPQDEYTIRLSIQRQPDSGDIEIRVANSGSHIDEAILEHIRNHTVTPKGNGVGLLNIDSRLRIVFGDSYHLHFENSGDMAIVWFLIPYSEPADRKRKE